MVSVPGSAADPAASVAGDGTKRRFRLLYLLPVLVFALLSALFMVRLHSGDPARLPSALIGKVAPSFDLPPLDGLRDAAGRPVPGVSGAELKAGRVTVVNVWASWCAPCRIEHPVLMELSRDPAIRLIGIDYKDKAENARRFLGNFGNPFSAVGADETGRTAIDFGVYGVPETFVIGPDGVIRHKHVGPLTPEAVPGFLERVRAASR